MENKYTIRHAKLADLDEITNLEQLCFPEKEAASKAAFFERLSVYAEHFLLLEREGHIISMVNGMVTTQKDLADEMYHDAKLHTEQGDWQMIFGVETHPEYQSKGYAAAVLNAMIEEARQQNRLGVVLTCKEELIPYYERFGFVNEGVSVSEHGEAVWYQMRMKLY
ncbi:MAG: GNAT family N-acetyltransferase [Lachnospiraceae bacterium]|nr:GNAT family N-acetyltransferase [Lachnospiraceae bacterium]